MKIIAHRGNINGRQPARENTHDYIIESMSQFDVEIDIWLKKSELYLGHDKPEEKTNLDFLLKYSNKLWIHCKNIEALDFLKNFDLNCFGHDFDRFVLTSKGFIFTYPKSKQSKWSVLVDLNGDSEAENIDCFGICTDYPIKYL